jgi:hypothetical protein
VFGIDVVAKLQEMSGPRKEPPAPVVQVVEHEKPKPRPPEAPPKQKG